MTPTRILSVLAVLLALAACSQKQNVTQSFRGWPEREIDDSTLRREFVTPPDGYGEVAFYWWGQDTLDFSKLKAQIDILADAGIDGLCVNYSHDENGHIADSEPAFMSEDWKKIWNKASAYCARKGIGLGLSDYVLRWDGNYEVPQEQLNFPGILRYAKVNSDKVRTDNILKITENGANVNFDVADTPQQYKESASGSNVIAVRQLGGTELDAVYYLGDKTLCPEYCGESLDFYNQIGGIYDKNGWKGANYFFRDEMNFNLNLRSWCPEMPEIFKEKKGYDPRPYLFNLFIEEDRFVTPEAAKFRMDYAEVLTEIAEERYFKPIYEWNANKGLLFGCDNGRRGLNPRDYLDYFRACSWFTAPGNDAPGNQSAFLQSKVSSSIAHVYGRPRVWCEIGHSAGWDISPDKLSSMLDHHFLAGSNLVCLHGLSYSDRGCWWEWAPPDHHFREPYWPHMKKWLEYSQRMSYLMSQGHHVCDIAILYPTETLQAFPQANPDAAFYSAMELSNKGLDYDFIDYATLRKSRIENKELVTSYERYKVLILSECRVLNTETETKIREFIDKGGLVITVGGSAITSGCRKVGYGEDYSKLTKIIKSSITPDFNVIAGFVNHRRTGNTDIYMVGGIDGNVTEEITFRAVGKVEQWDAIHGTFKEIEAIRQDSLTTTVRFAGTKGYSVIYAFTPGKAKLEKKTPPKFVCYATNEITGDWDVEFIPTMNNKWGDFRLPASDDVIGVEAREFAWAESDESGLPTMPLADTSIYGYGARMRTVTLPKGSDIDAFLKQYGEGSVRSHWRPYTFSWEYGVPDSPGSQGQHGLKDKVDPEFIILDKEGHQIFETQFFIENEGTYKIVKSGVEPYCTILDGKKFTGRYAELGEGWHSLLVAYANTVASEYKLENLVHDSFDTRPRAMVSVCRDDNGKEVKCMSDSRTQGCYFSFPTAPGTKSMAFEVNGTIDEMWIGGRRTDISQPKRDSRTGLRTYRIDIPEINASIDTVILKATPSKGNQGAAFFANPVKLECKGGKMPAGDWSKMGALKFFSGGIRYTKEVELADTTCTTTLCLGEVGVSCEVCVNGQFVDEHYCQPFSLDITPYIKCGSNRIEVIVYSNLSNHLRTIPSPYRQDAKSGLIGPVTILTDNIPFQIEE